MTLKAELSKIMVTVGYVLPVLQFLQNMRNGVALFRLRKSDVDVHI